MKKIILLSALTSSMLLATNGDLMFAHGAKATGMGGVGIAVSHGAESAYANPAMLKDVQGREFDASVTMFMPDVNFKSTIPNGTPNPNVSSKSDADRSFLPEFSYIHRNSDNVVWGIAVGGTAGMGVDQVNKPSGAFNMKTELQVAKLGIPVAYTTGALTLAVEPVLQYSTLQMNYLYQSAPGVFSSSTNPKSSSTGFGVNLGAAYEAGNLTFGALYQSKIEASYKDNISSAMTHFQIPNPSGDNLDQPSEMGIGLGYKMGNNTFGADIKRVKWSDAKGYKEFNWEDQTIVSLGYQYKTPTWALRAGYNHAKSPIKELDGSFTPTFSNYANAATNFFNLAGFPAVVETHYTLGGDYAISENMDLSLAVVYSPEVTETFDTSTLAAAATGGLVTSSSATVKHSQKALTVGMTYKF